jgi:hypothetical protein
LQRPSAGKNYNREAGKISRLMSSSDQDLRTIRRKPADIWAFGIAFAIRGEHPGLTIWGIVFNSGYCRPGLSSGLAYRIEWNLSIGKLGTPRLEC